VPKPFFQIIAKQVRRRRDKIHPYLRFLSSTKSSKESRAFSTLLGVDVGIGRLAGLKKEWFECIPLTRRNS